MTKFDMAVGGKEGNHYFLTKTTVLQIAPVKLIIYISMEVHAEISHWNFQPFPRWTWLSISSESSSFSRFDGGSHGFRPNVPSLQASYLCNQATKYLEKSCRITNYMLSLRYTKKNPKFLSQFQDEIWHETIILPFPPEGHRKFGHFWCYIFV